MPIRLLRQWLALAAVLGAAVALFPPFLSPDSYDYMSMTAGRAVMVIHGRRILTPWLASWFPRPFVGFEVITVIALATAGVLFLIECGQLGLDSRRQLFAVSLLLTLPQPAAFLLQNRWLVDPLMLAFWIGGIVAILARRDWWLCGVIAAGASNKEVVVLLAAVWFAYNVKRDNVASSAARAILIAIPGIVVLEAIAVTHPASISELIHLWRHSFWEDPVSLRTLIRAAVTAGLPLLVVLPWRPLRRDMKRLMAGGALAMLPLLCAASATDRMLGLAAPMWVPAVAEAFAGWQVAMICAGDVLISRSVILTQDAWMRPFGLVAVAVPLAVSVARLVRGGRSTPAHAPVVQSRSG